MSNKNTPSLITALRERDNLWAEILINEGVDIDEKDEIGEFPLYQAILQRNHHIFELLIKKGANISIDLPGYSDSPSLLIFAVKLDEFDMAETLIDKGADVNITGEYERTALDIALAKHRNNPALAGLVEKLVAAKIDVNTQDSLGVSPLHRAGEHDRSEVVEILLKAGADINAKTNDGRAPEDVATGSSKEILKNAREAMRQQ